ncbi:MAG: hypothetical protein IJY01_08380 [Clostridia bacterium]|nr:hypothetical protein [Clostridia bacterium]
MKKLLYFLIVLALMLATLAGCDSGNDESDGPDEKPDTQEKSSLSLLLGDISLKVGAEYELPSSVVLNDKELKLTYSFTGSFIDISQTCVLTALSADKTVAVSAEAEGFSASFKVKTLADTADDNTGGTVPPSGAVTLSASAISVPMGTTYSLPQKITRDTKQYTLTYTSSGAGIAITNYTVIPKTAGSSAVITALAEDFKLTFTVTVPAVGKGDMIINAPEAIYTNYSGKPITVTFTNPLYASDVTYTCNLNNVTIEDGRISAKGLYALGTYETATVTARATHFEKTFTVKVSSYIKGDAVNVEPNVLTYEESVVKNGKRGGTLFIGDSYFDAEFFSDFYTNSAYGFDDKTYQLGLCSSGIEEWELVSERLVIPMAPSEICVHIGFNDVHFRGLDSSTLPPRLMTLFNKYREEIPGVKIYYFGIEPRKSDTAATYEKAIATNEVMKRHAEENDWLTYIDTPSYAYNSSTQTVNTSYYRDGAHVKLEYYTNFTNALKAARDASEFDDIGTEIYIEHQPQGGNIGVLGNVYYGGKELKGDYVLSGNIKLTAITRSNPHLQLQFGSSNDRFLLWDKNSDGVLGVGYAEGGDYFSETDTGNLDFTYASYDSASSTWVTKNLPITMSFTLAVTDNEAYLYIDGVLKATIRNMTPTHLSIGALCIAAQMYDLEVCTKAADQQGYASRLATLGITY